MTKHDPGFRPGDPPPAGYLAWHSWAEVQRKGRDRADALHLLRVVAHATGARPGGHGRGRCDGLSGLCAAGGVRRSRIMTTTNKRSSAFRALAHHLHLDKGGDPD